MPNDECGMMNEGKTGLSRSSFVLYRSSFWAAILACIALYGLLYGPAISQATFLNDDWFHIEPIPRERIPHLFWGDWHQGYRHVGGFYRPFPRLVMQLERVCFGLWTPPYLLVSGAFHVLNCVLVWLVAMRLSRRPLVAAMAALVFAIYPTHPEALLQVSMLADLMATSGFLIAMVGYLGLWETKNHGQDARATQYQQDARATAARGFWVVALAGALLGALSKESWVTLPLVLLFAEWVWRPEAKRYWLDAKAWRRVGVFIAFGLVYVGFRQIALGGTGGYGIGLRLSSVRQTYDAVFRMVIFPFTEIERWGDLVNAFTLLGGMIIVWAVFGFPRLLLFAMGWMVLTTLPIVTLVPHLYDGGRLVYVVTAGWSLFLGQSLDALVGLGRNEKSQRAIGLVVAVVLAMPLVTAQLRYGADWRTSFDQNRRLVAEMAGIATKQSPGSRFAVLDWPLRFGVALSNRPDSAAKALSTLTGIESQRIDSLLAPDASSGTVTFTVTKAGRLSVGRVANIETRQWSGNRLDEWQPWGNARLAYVRSDGSRDYEVEDNNAGLVSPAIGTGTGYYSISVRYQSTRQGRAFVMWHGPGESFDATRLAILRKLPRLANEAKLANPGWVSGLNRVLFVPAIARGTVTVRSIEIARFDVRPFRP